MRHVFGCVVLLAAAVPALAADALTVTVTGAKEERKNVIVRATFPAGDFGKATNVRVQDTTTMLLAQFTPRRLLNEKTTVQELVFFIPELKTGETRTYKVVTAPNVNVTPARFDWKDTPNQFAELSWKRPILRYMYAPLDESSKEKRDQTFKVFHHLYDPTGERIVTNGAGGKYPHHRGLFFGFNKVSYGKGQVADVWHCNKGESQTDDRFFGMDLGTLLGRTHVKIAWRGQDKNVFAEEDRELTAFRMLDANLIEFASIVRTKAGPVRLDGDPQHAGFHFRAHNDVAVQDDAKMTETYFLRPDGKGKIGETRNWDPKTKKGPVNLPWNAMSFTLGEKRYTVVYLDHPDNPKEARGSERTYGRIGSYFEYDLTEDKPLMVNYRIWLQEGEMTVDQCEALSRDFTDPVKVVVK